MLKISTALANVVNTFVRTKAANQMKDMLTTELCCSTGEGVELGKTE